MPLLVWFAVGHVPLLHVLQGGLAGAQMPQCWASQQEAPTLSHPAPQLAEERHAGTEEQAAQSHLLPCLKALCAPGSRGAADCGAECHKMGSAALPLLPPSCAAPWLAGPQGASA